MKTQHVLNCSFSSWYSTFKNVTPRSYVIPLPKQFVEYLRADCVVLPEGSGQIQPKAREDAKSDDEDYFDDDYEWGSNQEDMPVVQAPNFPELEKRIRSYIEQLGGEVFPKLNWSAPKDASWISFNKSLCCSCPADIYLLLKSSDFIAYDLTCPFEYCEDNALNQTEIQYDLILRSWKNVHPGTEFRCFVKNGTLIAICQRHESEYYDFIKQQHEDIKADIVAFFKQSVSGRFADKEYVFDVCRVGPSKVFLLDFNPYGLVTDSLIFSWQELLTDNPFQKIENGEASNSAQLPVFRYILESQSGVKPSPYAYYALPKDFVDLSLGTDPLKLIDVLKMQNNQTTDEETSEEENC